MLSFVRRRLTVGNVVLTLALVFAMTGGAFAAGKFLITSTKQISPKVLKSLQGKVGPAGAAGVQGAAGPAGPAGSQGPAGPGGAAGAKGDTGSVGPQGSQGPKGAAGASGPQGPQGEPWTAGGTLPKGKSEMGAWATPIVERNFYGVGDPRNLIEGRVSVSFVIPLTAALVDGKECGAPGKEPCHIQVKEEGYPSPSATPAELEQCPGTVAEPKAKEGFLCMYEKSSGAATPNLPVSYSYTSGAVVRFTNGIASGTTAEGTWAVTAS